MDLFEAIANRHSYRGPFTQEDVSRADLKKIVQAGLDAPSGKNCQTTDFIIVDDTELVERIAVMHETNKAFKQAEAFIACIIDKDPELVYEGHSFQIEDCAAAVENMLLAVTALGYATVWVDGWLRVENRAETIGSLLGVPEEKVIRILLPIGVPGKPPKGPAKKAFEQRVWFNWYSTD